MLTYFKRWIKALEMISAGAGVTTEQITTIVTDYTLIIMLKNKRKVWKLVAKLGY